MTSDVEMVVELVCVGGGGESCSENLQGNQNEAE
jgi:hypothetical protein